MDNDRLMAFYKKKNKNLSTANGFHNIAMFPVYLTYWAYGSILPFHWGVLSNIGTGVNVGADVPLFISFKFLSFLTLPKYLIDLQQILQSM